MTGIASTVLIVEDEEMVRDIAATEFADAGWSVLEAADGRHAIALLESGKAIDLLFTDIRLPGNVDGWQIAERARVVHPDLPVIYATGYSADDPRIVPGGRLFRKPYLPTAVIEAAHAMNPRRQA